MVDGASKDAVDPSFLAMNLQYFPVFHVQQGLYFWPFSRTLNYVVADAAWA